MTQLPAPTSFETLTRSQALAVAETLATGAAGGLVFLWAGLPGGLISGSMLSVGIAAMTGRPMTLPPLLTQVILLVLGISLGSVVTRQLVQNIGSYPVSIGLLALATFFTTFGGAWYLQRLHRWDRTSALLACSPGALSQVMMLAVEKEADVPAIAVVQTLRVIALTAALPVLLAIAGLTHPAASVAAAAAASPLELAGLVAAALAVSLLLRLAKFPASWMFGAMLASGTLHGAGLIEGGLPPALQVVALIGIGALMGSRFARIRIATLLGHLRAATGAFAVTILISAAFVGLTMLAGDVRFADVVVAFAPGAMDTMLALALTLHIDPVFVGAQHLSRFVFVSITTPGIVHLFGRPQDDVDD